MLQLRQALDHLEAQDRLASLGLLSASVAHEMNTPLAVLHGSIEKLLETVPDAHAQDRLRRILRVTQRLRTISEGLVDFARVRKKTTESVNVKGIIDEAWALVAIDEKAGQVKFDSQVPEDLTILGNSDRLVQVFVNLFRNSLNAVDTDGLIAVAGSSTVVRASLGSACRSKTTVRVSREMFCRISLMRLFPVVWMRKVQVLV